MEALLAIALPFLKANIGSIGGILAYALVEWVLPRTKIVKANSMVELGANTAKKLLLDRVPVIGRLISLLATPEAKAVEEALGVVPPAPAAMVLVLASLLSLSGCAAWKSQVVTDVRVKCVEPEIKKQLTPELIAEVTGSAITGGEVWKQELIKLEALGICSGESIAKCAVKVAFADLFSKSAASPARDAAAKRMEAYLASGAK